ncbi:MAG: LysR family transcriptional regulator [Marinomonas foliarum]|uniref:LysR family transcriptional regulator n=1 Tax=Marinomonas foliarum TaxID=491950 RepID=UPI003F9E4012
MELQQLRMFKAIADLGSIAKAAEKLHCVPSNITTRIKQLEDELGEPLLIRKGRGVILSPSGSLFLEYANKILLLSLESKRAIARESAPAGRLSIGAIESSATSRLPKLLSKYHQRHPKVDIEFSTNTWKNLEEAVEKHELDSAIIAVKCVNPAIECVEIYREELVLIASSSFGPITSPTNLIGKNIYMWPTGCPYRKALESWLEQNSVSAQITSIASYGTILGCVSAGAGVSLVPKGIYEQFRQIGGVEGYVFNQLHPVTNYFIWNKNTGYHSAKDAFLELIRTELTTPNLSVSAHKMA